MHGSLAEQREPHLGHFRLLSDAPLDAKMVSEPMITSENHIELRLLKCRSRRLNLCLVANV